MGSNKVAVGLRDGAHSNLVVGTGEEAGEGGTDDNVAVSAGHPDADPDQILLGDEALHEAVRESVLVSQGEGGVLCVSVQGNDIGTALPKLYQRITIYLTRGKLGREKLSLFKTL